MRDWFSAHLFFYGKIAKMVPKLFTRGQVHPRTFKRVNMVPQLCFLAQTCPCADVVLQGAMRWMWNVHFCLWYWELLVLLIFACAFLTFFLFLTFWSLMYLYVLCFYRMCSTFNIMFSIKFYNIKHRAFCMCSTSIVFVKQWEAIIWLSCAGLCVFSWSRGTCKKNQAGACPTEGTWGRLHRLDP